MAQDMSYAQSICVVRNHRQKQSRGRWPCGLQECSLPMKCTRSLLNDALTRTKNPTLTSRTLRVKAVVLVLPVATTWHRCVQNYYELRTSIVRQTCFCNAPKMGRKHSVQRCTWQADNRRTKTSSNSIGKTTLTSVSDATWLYPTFLVEKELHVTSVYALRYLHARCETCLR